MSKLLGAHRFFFFELGKRLVLYSDFSQPMSILENFEFHLFLENHREGYLF